MNEVEKERRCKSCGKLLIDEKAFCRRCKLKGRNKVGQVGGLVASAVTLFFSAKALVGDEENDDAESA